MSVSDRSAAVGIVMSAFEKEKEIMINAIILYTCILHTMYRCRALSNASPRIYIVLRIIRNSACFNILQLAKTGKAGKAEEDLKNKILYAPLSPSIPNSAWRGRPESLSKIPIYHLHPF